MRLFVPSLAFIDLETTGMGARADGITEVGVVRVDCAGERAEPIVREWTTLVNPRTPIPPEIQAMTGITNAMVREAPSFNAISSTLRTMLDGALLVAHNARFDYAFLKHAFYRLGERFNARVLCTVKLSRRMFPQAQGHGLDALIARHHLACTARHRALGDARALWEFVQALYRECAPDDIERCVRRILRTPSLPAHLPPDVLDGVPESPGVYLFYGLNSLPLYIGKSRNLRERIGAHFSSDHQCATDLRLSSETRRIEHEETAGEIGALLRESALVKHLLPAHNHALRRKRDAGVLELPDAPGAPRFLTAEALEPRALAGRYGPFTSPRHARELLHRLAREHRLCFTALGLEHRVGPCFARQLRRCGGACVAEESALDHHRRVTAALAPFVIPPWPFAGLAVMYETAELSERVDAHLLRDWCWLGTARDEAELGAMIEAPPRVEFDIDIARLLITTWRRGRLPIKALTSFRYERAWA